VPAPDDVLDHLALLPGQVDALLAEADDVDLRAAVPACPGWDVAALLDHLGGTYRWAAAMLRSGTTERAHYRDVVPAPGPDPRTWLRESADDVLEALRGTAPDAPAWTFGPQLRASFWPRRLLHESAVHTADVALAAGRAPSVPAAVARDGIAEHLLVVPRNPGVVARAAALAPAAPVHLRLEETGAPDGAPAGAWLLRWDAGGSTPCGTAAAAPRPDVVVRGGACGLLLALWRRTDDVVVEGDDDVWRRWSSAHAL